MAKPEWGAKHVCENCGLKYYDMRRNPISCPSCGEKVTVAATRSRRSRGSGKPEPVTPAAPAATDGAAAATPAARKDDDNGESAAEDGGGGKADGKKS